MIFKQSARTDPEQIFIVCRNTSGGTISANAPVNFEIDEVSDGNAISHCNAADNTLPTNGLFAGITDAEMLDDAYGLVQVYGIRSSCYCATNVSTSRPGTPLIPTSGYYYLTDTTSSAMPRDFHFVNLMETNATSGVTTSKVFIRAL